MQSGFVKSFNGRLRDGLLTEHLAGPIAHARVMLARWLPDYNANRSHSLGWLTPSAYAATLARQRGQALHTGKASRLAPVCIPPNGLTSPSAFRDALPTPMFDRDE